MTDDEPKPPGKREPTVHGVGPSREPTVIGVGREPTVIGVGREPTMIGVAPPAEPPRSPDAPEVAPPMRKREATILGVAPPAVEPTTSAAETTPLETEPANEPRPPASEPRPEPRPPAREPRLPAKEPSVIVPAGVPRGGTGWKVLLVFALGIGGGLAYLNRERIAAELTPAQPETPTPDVVTLTAPRPKPADERPAIEMMPSAPAPIAATVDDAGARKDGGAATIDAGARKDGGAATIDAGARKDGGAAKKP